MAWFCENVFYSAFPQGHRECKKKRKRERIPRHPPGPDLALAQRDGTHFLGELHDIGKLVEVCSGVSARGQDKDEGSGAGRLLEDHGQV